MQRNYSGKKVVVVGAGRSGLALAAYFRRRGAAVVLSDNRAAERLGPLAVPPGVILDLGGHTPAHFEAADLVAISPGVPLESPPVAAAIARGVPVLGEVEIAFGELTAPLAAITGTNGKSTTTMVMGEALRAWGKNPFVGGNLGIPLIEAVDGAWDWLVAEISSFQLEAIRDFRPGYALLLNVTEDHLDRYPDMEAYLAAKLRIFENMTESGVAVLNAEDPLVVAATAGLRPRRVFFSSRRMLPEGMGVAGETIVWRHDGVETRFPIRELRLKGLHNVENVMAALVPPLLAGCPAGDRLGRRLRLCRPAAPDGAGAGAERGHLVQRLQGDQRRQRGEEPRRPAGAGDPDRRRQGQRGRLCPPGRAGAGEGEKSGRYRPGGRPPARRPRRPDPHRPRR